MTKPQMEAGQVPGARSGNLREKIPGVTAWIDSLREAFGKEMVNEMIRTGLKKGTFWAVENGNVVGQPPADVLDKHFAERANPDRRRSRRNRQQRRPNLGLIAAGRLKVSAISSDGLSKFAAWTTVLSCNTRLSNLHCQLLRR